MPDIDTLVPPVHILARCRRSDIRCLVRSLQSGPGARDLPTQHRDFMPQHQDLRVLSCVTRASSASQPNTRIMNR